MLATPYMSTAYLSRPGRIFVDRSRRKFLMARGYTSGLMTGMAVSMVAALLAPVWRPAVSRWGRPAAKTAVRWGLDAYDSGREKLAELGERMEDIVAEAQLERAVERMGDIPGESPAAPPSDNPAAS
jgi:Protein of unknown function (DUF5132)